MEHVSRATRALVRAEGARRARTNLLRGAQEGSTWSTCRARRLPHVGRGGPTHVRHAMHVSILVCYTSGDLVGLASIDACLTRRTWNSRVSYDVILTPHESTHVPRVAARVRVLHLCVTWVPGELIA